MVIKYLQKLGKIFLLPLLMTGCMGSEGGSLNSIDIGMDYHVPNTALTIRDRSELIGGALANGRVGDVLLENDKIRVIIDQPGKLPWVQNFGGTIIDADLVRSNGAGQDNFGFLHPLINIEWTVNVFDYEVISDGKDGGDARLRTYGLVDPYDYLDLDFISPVAEAITGEHLFWSQQFDDLNAPFHLTSLSNLNPTIVTDYILEPGKNYVRIETTYENLGSEDISFPVGEFVNGSGELMFLIPGLGFTPEMMPQIQGITPALIYAAFPGNDVSYGFFYDLGDFTKETKDKTIELLKSTSLSYSGVTGLLFGEDFIKLLPLGAKGKPKINFLLKAGESKTITSYFVVGDGNAGSVFDAGLKALGISTNKISGVVKNSNGRPLPGATVAVVNENDATVITYRTESDGTFSGELSTGESIFDEVFGSGIYKLKVYKSGYLIKDTKMSGTCNPEEIDIRYSDLTGIECTLGESGIIRLNGGVVDADSGRQIPARMTIIGYVPDYRSESGGYFEDKIIFEKPVGVVDVHYINAGGTINLKRNESIRIAPGRYELAFTHGTEYSMHRMPVDVSPDGVTNIGPIELKKIIDTSGYVSADFHLHSIVSPDSAMRPEKRVLAAAGEGMDILQSSDHDYLIDYEPYINRLEAEGIINSSSMISIVGQEISPNHMGHFNAFPLDYDENLPGGGAIDWSYTPMDVMGPDPDYVMSAQDIVNYLRALPSDPVIQINHIADSTTSLFVLSGWVTTPFYEDTHGIAPLSSYADPVSMRIQPRSRGSEYPYPPGSSDLVVTDFDTVELVIGPELHDNILLTSTLPQWFNLLNLGILVTATGDSDSHREIAMPLGSPRNFVKSSVDPEDGIGSFQEFNMNEYRNNIRDHKVIVTTGPFVNMYAENREGGYAEVGETITGNQVTLTVDVTSPDWAWFDTIEVYTNTDPIPAGDDKYLPLEGAADNPDEFLKPYHIRRFYYEPAYSFSLSEENLESWKEEDGLIKAKVTLDLDVEEDTWIVVFVRGTEGTEGYHSLFPFVTRALIDADNPAAEAEDFDIGNVNMLSLTGASAWAFTNPIFIDVGGDGFDSIYSGKLNLGKHAAEKFNPKNVEDNYKSHNLNGKQIIKRRKKIKAKSATSLNRYLLD